MQYLVRLTALTLAVLAATAWSVPPSIGQTESKVKFSGPTTTLPSGRIVAFGAERGTEATTIRISDPREAGLTVSGKLDRDQDVAQNARISKSRILAEFGDRVIILTDSYPSRPGSLSYCQAGEERFLRVLDVGRRQIRETMHMKLASCRQNVELALDGLQWSPDSAMLSIHWLPGPEHVFSQATQVFRIGLTGTTRLIAER